jgi:hypothetical protein
VLIDVGGGQGTLKGDLSRREDRAVRRELSRSPGRTPRRASSEENIGRAGSGKCWLEVEATGGEVGVQARGIHGGSASGSAGRRHW